MAAVSDNAFDVLVVEHGSGWKAVHVCVQEWHVPGRLVDKEGIICLTFEAIQHDEFERDIDELISQLQSLKAKGRQAIIRIQNQK